ncbi:MAG: pirin family protein [Bdellovibrionaceae bacterium]|nr:pirin family protein [Pseudobdellovibrionaceae bacterium]
MRQVQRLIASQSVLEGEGFLVHRPFPVGALSSIDPFLLIDELGPAEMAPGQAKGAPDHPHRGFQTISYVLEGGVVHKDSQGHSSELGPGDVQWMIAGDGVVHSEMPTAELLQKGGRVHSFQIWVNLPKARKRMAPQYQDIRASEVPRVVTDSGLVETRVIAGALLGAQGPTQTVVPTVMAHVILQANGEWRAELPATWNVLAYVIQGPVVAGGQTEASRATLIQFANEGGEIAIRNPFHERTEVLVLAAQPLREPVARMGPFVMNEPRELHEAYEDFISGRMGMIHR